MKRFKLKKDIYEQEKSQKGQICKEQFRKGIPEQMTILERGNQKNDNYEKENSEI